MAEQISASQGVNKIINGYKDTAKEDTVKEGLVHKDYWPLKINPYKSLINHSLSTKIKWYKRRHSNQNRDYRMTILKVIISILLGVKDKGRDSSRRLPQHFLTGVRKINKLQLGSKSDSGRIQNTLPDTAKNGDEVSVKMDKNEQELEKRYRKQSSKPAIKESYRGGIKPESWILFQSVSSSKKIRRHASSTKSTTIKKNIQKTSFKMESLNSVCKIIRRRTL
ncbi:hypothetical protein BB558_002936 [Smittium angustum]|uniref:Uncharacterized protein n=1 Tax=Smittium angustum TaxID=133377 RepID=A0A2U1J7B4_SMIAN|nr:hypothetical protein BB558_002936 [Smittium angustum]